MLHRGNATSNDTISVPTLSDLQNLTDSGENFNGPEERLSSRGLTVVEGDVVCVGVSGLSRSKMAEVRKKRITSSIVQDYALTSTTQSRLIIGYTTSCGHRLTSSKDGGIGFCSLRGLMEAARTYHDFRVGGEGRREEREKGEGRRKEGETGRGGRGVEGEEYFVVGSQ
ncbi:hypothetical protein GBAR_LOCUS4063 [Geodia barretti]|uniref:POP1 C-terminal domain-containing protein n=1 Tax=Geodia barretti TaxID=519541 RepID=A0AA35W7X1_GEOBA|nr:hypothetical protein GBAR_LOCUS4063 [Geodia barretti]